jgi:orotate phosphoribosyltransferase
VQDELIDLLAARRGHFLLESGHHGELWLDLDRLFLRPDALRPFVKELAERLAAHNIEAVCGPLTGGAFVAQMIALELDVEFSYAERVARANDETLYSAAYRVPDGLRDAVQGKRVAVVDDAINAGSAVRATLGDLEACGARPGAIGALLVLGDRAAELAAGKQLPLVCVAHLPSAIWPPAECPLCAAGQNLTLAAR